MGARLQESHVPWRWVDASLKMPVHRFVAARVEEDGWCPFAHDGSESSGGAKSVSRKRSCLAAALPPIPENRAGDVDGLRSRRVREMRRAGVALLLRGGAVDE
jgi:hypothetical protein